MAKDYATQPDDKYVIRFPDGMRDELKAAAKANGRSLNAEIIHLIQQGQTATTDQITPRDLFAANALNALICADAKTVENAVAKSFFIADAMMNERNK